MSDQGVHKETFHQQADGGVPSHWVVFYWDEENHPVMDTHEARYFASYAEALAFEEELEAYEDWCSSQEEPIAVQ